MKIFLIGFVAYTVCNFHLLLYAYRISDMLNKTPMQKCVQPIRSIS